MYNCATCTHPLEDHVTGKCLADLTCRCCGWVTTEVLPTTVDETNPFFALDEAPTLRGEETTSSTAG